MHATRLCTCIERLWWRRFRRGIVSTDRRYTATSCCGGSADHATFTAASDDSSTFSNTSPPSGATATAAHADTSPASGDAAPTPAFGGRV